MKQMALCIQTAGALVRHGKSISKTFLEQSAGNETFQEQCNLHIALAFVGSHMVVGLLCISHPSACLLFLLQQIGD